jgi:hypothetical protein
MNNVAWYALGKGQLIASKSIAASSIETRVFMLGPNDE